jgi:hypothetical protein
VVGRSAAWYVLVLCAAREAREIFTGTDQCHQQDGKCRPPGGRLAHLYRQNHPKQSAE